MWVVDGRFFRNSKEKRIEMLSGEAVQMIKQKYPEADIFLHSSEKDLDKIAEELGVNFFRKRDYTAGEVADELKKRIENE
ncbi:hypothetical protein KAT80_03880 [Candidatus Pacearchaeota archaeon]|nr:hypothetical protein [Candidatus Pacearchaeota archaeon]